MAGGLPPPPTRADSGDFIWTAWYNSLYTLLSTTGAVAWDLVNKAGSSIADLQNKNHNLLTSFQGGTSGEYYHLTSADYTKVTTGLPVLAAGRIPFGNGTSTPATDADFTYDDTVNVLYVPGQVRSKAGSSLSFISGNGGGMSFTSQGPLEFYAGGTVTDGGPLTLEGSYGSASGSNMTVAAGASSGQGGSFIMTSGNSSSGDSTQVGGVQVLTGDFLNTLNIYSSAADVYDFFFQCGGLNAIYMQTDAGVLYIGFFGATPVVQPAAATALHTALSDLGLRAAGSPNDFALDYTNTATVGNVTINKASGQVIMGAGATTLTLTNSKIATTSRVLLTFAANPGVTTTLYAVAAAGSCTINATAALVNQSKINFMVVN